MVAANKIRTPWENSAVIYRILGKHNNAPKKYEYNTFVHIQIHCYILKIFMGKGEQTLLNGIENGAHYCFSNLTYVKKHGKRATVAAAKYKKKLAENLTWTHRQGKSSHHFFFSPFFSPISYVRTISNILCLLLILLTCMGGGDDTYLLHLITD